MPKIDYLVTGTGRCGSVYMARLLTSLGIPCSHEAIFNPGGIDRARRVMNGSEPVTNSHCSRYDLITKKPIEDWVDTTNICAESSYMAAPFLDDDMFSKSKIIHAVRNPMKVISSHIKDINFFEPGPEIELWSNFVLKHMPSLNEISNTLEKACFFYINWNMMIEKQSTQKPYLLHKVENECNESLLQFLGVPNCGDKAFKNTKINSWKTRQSDICLEEIPDGSIKKDLIKIATRYGYNIQKKVYL
jgi:hypothetical protein